MILVSKVAEGEEGVSYSCNCGKRGGAENLFLSVVILKCKITSHVILTFLAFDFLQQISDGNIREPN